MSAIQESITTKIQSTIDKFNSLDQWEDKYKKIIAIGKGLEAMPEELVVDDNKVKGCQSQVWLFPKSESSSEKITFYADSDALIAKGLVALVLEVYNNSSCDEVLATEPEFFNDIGLKEHLSPNRSNGLFAMVKQIKMYAFAIKMKG